MKNHSRVLSKLCLEKKVKLGSEASQENCAFLNYTIRENNEISTLGLSKSGDTNQLVHPTFQSAGHVLPLPPSPTPLDKFTIG